MGGSLIEWTLMDCTSFDLGQHLQLSLPNKESQVGSPSLCAFRQEVSRPILHYKALNSCTVFDWQDEALRLPSSFHAHRLALGDRHFMLLGQ